jgi:hypothetical protein
MRSSTSGAATRSRRRSGSVILGTLDGPTSHGRRVPYRVAPGIHDRVASGLARADARSGATR